MKKIFLSFVTYFVATALINAQTAEEIIAKHIAARGGAEKLRNVRSVVMDNTLGAQGMEFENKMIVVVGKAMRSESKIMGADMVQAFDGETAWAIMPTMMGGTGEPQAMPTDLAKGVSAQTDPFPLLDFAAKGSKAELLGTEKVKDVNSNHLKLTNKDGDVSEFWIGVDNNLVTKIKVSQAGQEAELFYSNYKETDGITFPMTMETSNPMAGTITIDTKAVVINGPIDEAIFKFIGKK
jgi:hypothetical protein